LCASTRLSEPHKARDRGASASKTTSQPATNLLSHVESYETSHTENWHIKTFLVIITIAIQDRSPSTIMSLNLNTTSSSTPEASQTTSNDEGKKRTMKEEDGGSDKRHKTDSIEEVCRSRTILECTCLSILNDFSFSYQYRRRNVVTLPSRGSSSRTCKSSWMICRSTFKREFKRAFK
jgi:hypothetical protein